MERQSYFKDLSFFMQCMNPVKGLRDIGVRRYCFREDYNIQSIVVQHCK